LGVLGPELLQAVPVALQQAARSNDVVGQYQRARRTLAVRAFSVAVRAANSRRYAPRAARVSRPSKASMPQPVRWETRLHPRESEPSMALGPMNTG
jgi:hypothetical protein